MEHGVPQGSILGPLLFLVFINDIVNVIPELKVKLFADDTNIFLFNKSLNLLFSEANKALDKLSTWFSVNKLSINVDKTHYCIFKKSGQKQNCDTQYPELKLNNQIIERVQSTKYLGITIDELTTFKEHTNNIANTLMKYCGIFYKFRTRLPSSCLKTIYFAMIHSHINYGIAIYANTTDNHLDPLIKMNNKILRILQNKSIKTPIEILYKNYNTLQIPQLRDFNIICLIHKFVHSCHELPEIYRDYFIYNSEIHSHKTRKSSALHLIQTNSNLGQRNIKFMGSRLWNKTPISIKMINNINIFRKKLKIILGNNKIN